MVRRADISYRRTFQGAWALSAVVGDRFEERLYFYYTKREATTLFLDELNGRTP